MIARRSPWLPALALAVPAGCASAPADAGTPPQIQAAWEKFLADDPGWPEAREAWFAAGDRERARLLEALFFVLIQGDEPVDPDRGQRWQRAARELVYFGADAVPYLVTAFRAYGGKAVADRVAVDRIGSVLADLYATEPVGEVLVDPDSGQGLRSAAARALGLSRDDAAMAFLERGLREDPTWEVRALCVEALARWRDQGEAQLSLARALEDPDPLVREKAASLLATARTRQVQEALLQGYERALADGDARQAAALHDALCTNTRRPGPPRSPAAWRLLLDEER